MTTKSNMPQFRLCYKLQYLMCRRHWKCLWLRVSVLEVYLLPLPSRLSPDYDIWDTFSSNAVVDSENISHCYGQGVEGIWRAEGSSFVNIIFSFSCFSCCPDAVYSHIKLLVVTSRREKNITGGEKLNTFLQVLKCSFKCLTKHLILPLNKILKGNT